MPSTTAFCPGDGLHRHHIEMAARLAMSEYRIVCVQPAITGDAAQSVVPARREVDPHTEAGTRMLMGQLTSMPCDDQANWAVIVCHRQRTRRGLFGQLVIDSAMGRIVTIDATLELK